MQAVLVHLKFRRIDIAEKYLFSLSPPRPHLINTENHLFGPRHSIYVFHLYIYTQYMFILFIQKILYIFNVFAAELYKNGGGQGGLCPQMVRVPDQPHLHLRPAAEDGGLRGRDPERGGPQHQVPQGD